MIKLTVKDLGLRLEGLGEEQRVFAEKIAEMTTSAVNKGLEGAISKEDLEAEIEKALQENNEKFSDYEEIKNQNVELLEKVKNLGGAFEKLKQKGVAFSCEAFAKKFDEMYNSERFQKYVDGHKDASGKFDFNLKELVAVSMTNNYEGEVLVTRQDNRPVVEDINKTLHMRDIIPVIPGDPASLSIAWPVAYDFDRNARFLTENGALPKSSFKVKELNTGVTRLGTQIDLSKRMLKSRAYVMSLVLTMLPEAIYMAEDASILFGNGTNNQLPGILSYKEYGISSVEKLLGDAVVSGEAGSIESIEPCNDNKDAVVTFTKAYDHIKSGMTLILSGCTNESLNKPLGLVKMNDRQILVKGVNITANDTNAESATFKVNMAGFKNILTPNSEDVIRTAATVMTIGQYRPSAVVLNYADVNMMQSEKDTLGRSLDLVKIVNGVKTIAGLPILETGDINPGEYVLGDFRTACTLVEYTKLSLEFADDVNYKSMNMVACLAQEELILQVRMPFAFAYGNLDELRQAITKE